MAVKASLDERGQRRGIGIKAIDTKVIAGVYGLSLIFPLHSHDLAFPEPNVGLETTPPSSPGTPTEEKENETRHYCPGCMNNFDDKDQFQQHLGESLLSGMYEL